jgi:hypothetical protein
MEQMKGPLALNVFRGLFLVAGYTLEANAAAYSDTTHWMNFSASVTICGSSKFLDQRSPEISKRGGYHQDMFKGYGMAKPLFLANRWPRRAAKFQRSFTVGASVI